MLHEELSLEEREEARLLAAGKKCVSLIVLKVSETLKSATKQHQSDLKKIMSSATKKNTPMLRKRSLFHSMSRSSASTDSSSVSSGNIVILKKHF